MMRQSEAIESAAKRLRRTIVASPQGLGCDVPEMAASKKVIGTHHGTFHCDEALAVGLLKSLPEYSDAAVVRTRDNAILDQCSIVVDVGGTYDAAALRFDHHQRGFMETFDSEHKTKLSSAGLVYKHFGKQIVAHHAVVMGCSLSPSDLDEVYLRLYDDFVEHIDGIDNGVESHSGERNYKVSTNLSARVGHLNPSWNETSTEEEEMSRFRAAAELTFGEFAQSLESKLKSWLPARSIVVNAIQAREEACKGCDGQVVRLDSFCPWKGHVFDAEKNLAIGEGHLKYILYPDTKGNWRIQAIPVSSDSFTSRLPLPEKLRGLRDEELSSACGIDGCIFIHAAGFIGGNKTFDGALKMAQFALQ